MCRVSGKQRRLDTAFRKCHCLLLERLTFAPLALSPRILPALLAARGCEQTPRGAGGAMLRGKGGGCV